MEASEEIETKVIYHVCEEDTPYRVKVAAPPTTVTLADLKKVIKREGYKYFFKAKDDDFGSVFNHSQS